jgi:hypothetical protein
VSVNCDLLPLRCVSPRIPGPLKERAYSRWIKSPHRDTTHHIGNRLHRNGLRRFWWPPPPLRGSGRALGRAKAYPDVDGTGREPSEPIRPPIPGDGEPPRSGKRPSVCTLLRHWTIRCPPRHGKGLRLGAGMVDPNESGVGPPGSSHHQYIRKATSMPERKTRVASSAGKRLSPFSPYASGARVGGKPPGEYPGAKGFSWIPSSTGRQTRPLSGGIRCFRVPLSPLIGPRLARFGPGDEA